MTRHNDPFVDDFLREMMEAGINLDSLAGLGGVLPHQRPPDDLRLRLMQSLRHGRLHRFAEQVAELLHVSVERARALIDGIDDPDVWERGPSDGVTLYHIDGGPEVADAITGFVRVEREQSFPEHSHLGDEAVLIMQGACRDSSNGEVHRPGDVVRTGVGHAHGIDVLPGPKLIYLAVVFGGIDIDGLVLLPGDPRI
jgi:quercetin dioxygenase-like cupin family protein